MEKMKLIVQNAGDGSGYYSHLLEFGDIGKVAFDDVSKVKINGENRLLFSLKGSTVFVLEDENFIETFLCHFGCPEWSIGE